MSIWIKRVYEPPVPEDGTRILVDRLWPRGLAKSKASIDLWLKEIAPSQALRGWFAHRSERWDEFQNRYHRELDQHRELVDQLIGLCCNGNVTLLYGARDRELNNAVALRTYLEEQFARVANKS